MNQPFHCAKNIGSILKTLTVMIGLSGLFMAARGQLLNYEFTNFSMGTTGSLSFTTNNFTSVGVGAENRIWAGSQYGGLYYMDDDGI
ncbi:MAG: hypothetical protein MUE99_10760, partial [Chitinophagaceae bacterium]|nr:hypothetical protein [Chitinophagaceae bacterium]